MSSRKISKATVVCLLAVLGCAFMAISLIVCKNIFSEEFLLYHRSIPFSAELGMLICSIAGVVIGIAGISLKKVNILDRIICCICTLLCICFILGMLLPALINSRVMARRISCASNLRQIYLALQQYAADNSGYYPPTSGTAGLTMLIKDGDVVDYAVYTCPSTQTMRGSGDQTLTEEIIDYVYIGGLNQKSSPRQPLMYDKPNNHGNYFGNVLFTDGTVERIEGNPWTTNIKK